MDYSKVIKEDIVEVDKAEEYDEFVSDQDRHGDN
jgi:hypothetical protein